MKLDAAAVIGMFRGAAILGSFWILGTIYYNVDMLILQRLVPSVNLAWYAAAYRLFNIAVTMVGLVLGTVLYPVMSRLSVGSREALRRPIERWFALLVASGVFIAVTLAIAAEQIVALLYPAREYAEAATALRLLAPGLAAMYANGIFFLTLFAVRCERRLLVMAAALAVLNPLANLFLIPVLQQNGAALVTSATEAIVLVWVLAVTPRDLREAARPVVVLRVLAAAAPAAACLWLLRDFSILLVTPVAALVYVAGLVAFGALPASDLTALRAFVRQQRGRDEALDAGRAASPRAAER
jgi:O-antigen/teichoic acid export membrane protein